MIIRQQLEAKLKILPIMKIIEGCLHCIIFNKIIMNLLPIIDKPRRGFKFSNPLSGVTYNNNLFLQQCQYEPDPEKNTTILRKKSYVNANFSLSQKEEKGIGIHMNQSRNKNKFFSKTSDSKINYSMIHTNNSHVDAETNKVIKNVYKFPDIEIKIIDEIQSYKDFMEKNLRVNFGHYFGMFFKKSLAGALTIDMIEIVQKYLQILASKRSLDSPADTKDFPSQYFSLKSKRAFVQRIEELEVKKNFKPIEEMIKYYCVPTKQFRESCFRDIIHMISQSLYEKFNLNKERDYVLLDENGHIIQDICAIKFSTTQLLITTRPHYERSFNQFKSIIESNLQNFKKMSFSEELKKNFRARIAAGKFEESKLNQSGLREVHNRRMVESKMQVQRSPDKSLEKFNPARTTNDFLKSKSKQKMNRHRKSKSSLTSPVSKDKFHNLKMRTVSAKKREEGYRAAFQKLSLQNNIYDITFNHLNQNKLIMQVFKKQYKEFKNKTTEQVNAIIKAFKISPEANSIDWEEFRKISEVANCKGQNENIVEFVGRYLPFNQYGEMDKQSLASTLSFILNDVNGEEVVLEIIWSWLEKNNLIQNNVLVRNTLQSWYEKNKMAFVIMVSLIFGNNQSSWIDMAYEVLI